MPKQQFGLDGKSLDFAPEWGRHGAGLAKPALAELPTLKARALALIDHGSLVFADAAKAGPVVDLLARLTIQAQEAHPSLSPIRALDLVVASLFDQPREFA